MTFYSDCDECEYPEAEILASIEALMNVRDLIDTDVVKQVNFLGTGDVLITPENSSKGLNATSLSLSFGLLALGTVLFHKRRQKKRSSFESLDEQNDVNDDISIISKRHFKAEDVMNFSTDLTIEEDDEGVNVTFMRKV